ncbi:MAG TPA: hypothetical protein VF824_00615 [Thermoanaerobaculia bacterium]|jgi:hypothetical protein
MLKPVSILALDDASAALASAVQRRAAAACGLDDLVQMRLAGADPHECIASIHAQRQRPGSPLRARDDVSARELVLLVLSACGPARTTLLDLAASVRQFYDMRRLAELYTIEVLCLLPDLFASTTAADYGAAYSLLKCASAAEPKPFHVFWLLDATNAQRVRFGTLEESLDAYADAVTGALMLEPELSGAISGAFRPRGMDVTFSSFGYAELAFPRDVALQRLEPRLGAELVRRMLLAGEPLVDAPLRAKELVVSEPFAAPLARIGLDAGQSLFKRFQPKALVTENTRSADEVIGAVRNELKVHRDTTHLQNLATLSKQGEQTASDAAALLTRATDETLDRDGYAAAADLLTALLDPLPDLRADAVAPRNLVTEINAATAALDARLRFAPNHGASESARKRIRELDALLQDQKLVADTLAPVTAAEQLESMEAERAALAGQLPEVVFAEETENNAARNAARDAEAARLAEETAAREQQLRELFAQKPRAEQALREALETRRAWLTRRVLWAAVGVACAYGIPFFFDALRPNVAAITKGVVVGLIGYAIYSAMQYAAHIAPLIREAREQLARVIAGIETTDRAKNVAHNDELQFDYDVAHRRTTISVLRRTREAARALLDALRARQAELEELAASFVPASISSSGLSIALIDDAAVDAWYESTVDDRKPLFREFPIGRAESRRLPLEVLQQRVRAYVADAFDAFRGLTIADAAALADETALARRLKRFAEYAAPLIDVRADDLQAERAMQRDATLWLDTTAPSFVALVQRRLPDAHCKPAVDPLRVRALTRVLHYPAYALGQLEYYRAQYDSAQHPESAALPDLVPMPPHVRAAYEQVLLGRAFGLLDLGSESHLAAAERLASPAGAAERAALESALGPRLAVREEVERDLRFFASHALPPFERKLVDGLLARYAAVT